MKIAHLSDVHMLAPRAYMHLHLGLRFLSFGRPLDEGARALKLARALGAARAGGATHFVLSGDLTEIGDRAEFEALAGVLHEARLDPDTVTLVPGNHDTYASGTAWRDALEGPLAAFRAAAALEPGKVVDRGDVVILPVDVACHQPLTRSAGELTADTARALERRLEDRSLGRRSLVLVQHHPPFSHGSRAWQWLDGLRGHGRMLEMLARHDNAHVLHGHLHEHVDRAADRGRARVFGATATVDDVAEPRVRFYEVAAGVLRPSSSAAPAASAALAA